MKKYISLVIIFISLSFYAYSQTEGQVNIISDSRLETLLDKNLAIEEYESNLDGYRLQIFFDSGNNSQINANNARTEFLKRYSDVEAYVTFDTPYYKVRVGDFRTKLEAQSYLNKIFVNYPNTFIVIDKIFFPKVD